MLRILHLIDTNGMYGAEKVVLTLLRELRKSKCYCILGCIKQPKDVEVELGKRAEEQGIHVEYFNMSRWLTPKALFNLITFIKGHHISIVHSHGYKPNIYLGIMPRRFLNIKVICTIHGWTKNFRRDLKLLIYEKTNCFFIKKFIKCVAVSNNVRDDMVNEGIPVSKIKRIYNGINLSEVEILHEKCLIRKSFNIPEDTFLIGAAGRLFPEKGVDIFIDGAVNFLRYHPNTLFLIAGDGPLLANYKMKVKKLGIEKNFYFLGFIDRIYEYLSMLDIFVLSSRTEGLPMVLLEAMSVGCPAVCSHVGGIPEVIENNINGLLFAPYHSRALSEKLALLFENKTLRNKLAINGKNKVKEMFSSKRMASEYLQLYYDILNSR